MGHDWVDANFNGIKGFWRCTRCGGLGNNIPKDWDGVTPIEPPSPDLKVNHPPLTCEQMIAHNADCLREQYMKMLSRPHITDEIKRVFKDMVS
jgi:hypothetical protein